MKTINSNHIIYIVTTCIFLIFVAQGYLVMDYFSTTRSGLIRESDAILEETFKQDLNLRNKIYKHIVGEDTLKQIPPHTKANTVNFDMSFKQVSHENVLNSLELTINSFISQTVPINIRTLDSVTSTVLRSRNIKSEFDIRLIDLKSDKTLSQSKPNKGLTIFQIPSQKLNIDLDKKQALQLTLLNPFGEILKRMGLMFLSSLSLAFICLLAFRYLIKILAKQKQLVTFKNEFLSNIAHELKRPVASLTFNLDCLSIPGTQTNPQQLQQLITRSVNATTELNDTITMIVSLSKAEEGLLQLNKTNVHIGQMLEQLENHFRSGQTKPLSIRIVLNTEQLTIKADEQLLHQCFANLMDNAIKYSGDDVEITVTVSAINSFVQIAVKDNGLGIPNEKLPNIFDKYTRAHTVEKKINGFGIGLNYVKTIVEKHKGHIELSSEVGKGSEFRVLLPR